MGDSVFHAAAEDTGPGVTGGVLDLAVKNQPSGDHPGAPHGHFSHNGEDL
jgi:hypothetical protein